MNRTGVLYTDLEVAACFYIARYGIESLGGWQAAAAAMHRKEVRCKVRNIVAMCLDFGICEVAPEFRPKDAIVGTHYEGLTGTAKNRGARKTNFDLVQQLAQKSQSELQDIIRPAFPGLRFSP